MRLLLSPLLLCMATSACSAPRQFVAHAPPEEAAKVEFPSLGLPNEGRYRLDGNTAAAIQLAMDDFLPREAAREAVPLPQPQCLRRRESYDVTAVPAPESVMLVRFDLNTAACEPTDPLINITTYAIDIRTMRLLSREIRTRRNPTFPLQLEAPPHPPGSNRGTDSH